MCTELGRILAAFTCTPEEFAFIQMIPTLECPLESERRRVKGSNACESLMVALSLNFPKRDEIITQSHSLEVCTSRIK